MIEFYSLLVVTVFGILCCTLMVAKILTAISVLFEEGETILGVMALAILIMIGFAIVKVALALNVNPIGSLLGYI